MVLEIWLAVLAARSRDASHPSGSGGAVKIDAAANHQPLGIPSASNTPGVERTWDNEMRRRLGDALRDGHQPSAYLRGELVRRAAEPMLVDSPLGRIDLRVAEVDGADVWTLCAESSPRPVHMWLAVVSKDDGVVTVAANSAGTVFTTELPAARERYRFTTVDKALDAVEDAVNWGLRMLALERRRQ
jgi:hypothetical protein